MLKVYKNIYIRISIIKVGFKSLEVLNIKVFMCEIKKNIIIKKY